MTRRKKLFLKSIQGDERGKKNQPGIGFLTGIVKHGKIQFLYKVRPTTKGQHRGSFGVSLIVRIVKQHDAFVITQNYTPRRVNLTLYKLNKIFKNPN